MDAAFALIPDKAQTAWDWPGGPHKAVDRLGRDLMYAIAERRDLRITGRDANAPPSAGRFVLSRDYFPGNVSSDLFVILRMMESRITIGPYRGPEFQIDWVRVERDPDARGSHEQMRQDVKTNGAPAHMAGNAGVDASQTQAPDLNRGGRPAKFNRTRINNRLREIANTPDGLPSGSALRDLVRTIATELAGEEPAPSTLADIMKDLELR